MLFAIVCTDKPGSLDLRMATRPAHLDYLQGEKTRIIHGGPLLSPEGQPCGSLLIVDAPDRDAAAGFAAADPYARAGLFESTIIRPYRAVFRDGALVE